MTWARTASASACNCALAMLVSSASSATIAASTKLLSDAAGPTIATFSKRPKAPTDYDEDGNTDLFVDGVLQVGQGDGTFTPKGASLKVDDATLFVAGDFDQDGHADLKLISSVSADASSIVSLQGAPGRWTEQRSKGRLGWVGDPPEVWARAQRRRSAMYELAMSVEGINERQGSWYLITYGLCHTFTGQTLSLGRADWFDWSRAGDVLMARNGKLRRGVENAIG